MYVYISIILKILIINNIYIIFIIVFIKKNEAVD